MPDPAYRCWWVDDWMHEDEDGILDEPRGWAVALDDGTDDQELAQLLARTWTILAGHRFRHGQVVVLSREGRLCGPVRAIEVPVLAG